MNPQVLCTCWSFPSHTALCSVWIGGTETHDDSPQGASSEFLRNSHRQGCPTRYLGTMSPSIGNNRRSCTTRVPPGRCHSIFKKSCTYLENPTYFFQVKNLNKQKSTPLSGDAADVPGESSGAPCGLLRLPPLFTIWLNVDVCMEMSLHPSQP